MQIPLEHTKTVQEFPDPPFRVLVMQYTQCCGNRRVWMRDYQLSYQRMYSSAHSTHQNILWQASHSNGRKSVQERCYITQWAEQKKHYHT